MKLMVWAFFIMARLELNDFAGYITVMAKTLALAVRTTFELNRNDRYIIGHPDYKTENHRYPSCLAKSDLTFLSLQDRRQ